MTYRIYVDSFETAFSDLKPRQWRDKKVVLEIAKREKRFSAFEMNQPLFETLRELEAEGHFHINNVTPYPWTALVFPATTEVK